MAFTQNQIEFPKVFITGPSGFIADVNSSGQLLTSGSGGGGSGTVTSFSAGTLSPLFTTSVATATTTPALTFTLSNAAQNTVLAGPTSGTGAPTYRLLVAGDLPAGTGTVTNVSFTGGLISVATPTTTPALTIAGTSGGIPYFNSATTWASSAILAATGLVIGGGAGTAPATNTALTFSGATLTVGLAGTSSGILSLAGSTSGSATITAPAVAGTATNVLVSSNNIQAPSAFVVNALNGSFQWVNANNSILMTNGYIRFVVGGNALFAIDLNSHGLATNVFGFNGTNTLSVADTGISWLAAGSLAIGNGTASDTTGNLSFNKILKYNAVATTGAGIPSEVGVVTATTASAAVTATTLLAAPVAGTLYRVSAYLKITVATTTPVAGPITLTYKDNDGVAQSIVMPLANATGAIVSPWATGSTTTTPVNGNSYIYAGSGTAIQYAIAFSGTGTYEYRLVCEAL
jgi:hypothetical protein